MSDATLPRRRFIRVYFDDIEKDHPMTFYDPTAFGTWVRLLILSEKAWPALPSLPRAIRRADLATLTKDGLFEAQPNDQFILRGWMKERTVRAEKAKAAVATRWEADPKIPGGKRASKRVRFAVLTRDAFTCRYCGRKPPTVALDVDHVVPVHKGGTDDLENLVAACADCNLAKSNTDVIPPQSDSSTQRLLAGAGDSPSTSISPSETGEEIQEKPDAAVAFHQRTGQFPGIKILDWLSELAEAHGESRLASKIGATPLANRKIPDYLRAVRDELRAEDYAAEKASPKTSIPARPKADAKAVQAELRKLYAKGAA